MTSTLTERLSIGGSSSVAVKAPCRVATTAAITLAGLQTIDGVDDLAEGDRVLVKNQSNGIENGIWIASTGNWSRAKDFNGSRDAVRGTRIYVNEGDNAPTEYGVTTDDHFTIGTDPIAFAVLSSINEGPPGQDGDDGADGDSAYVYIAYASDDSGSDFTTTFNASLDYIAIKTTTSPIAVPSAGDFSGLWKLYKGQPGEQGDPGNTGSTGATGDPGPQGDDGPPAAITFNFDDSTTDSDPGAGNVRFNNATLSSATVAYIDNARSGGGTVTGWLDTFDDSTNTANKGTLQFIKVGDPTAFRIYSVTGTVTDGTGYRKVTISHLAGNGTFTDGDELMALFFPAGNKGADGGGSGTVIGPVSSTEDNVATYNSTDGTEIKDSGVAIADVALVSVYDPGNVAGNAFDMDNMAEGTDTKIMTAAERSKLSGVESGADVTDGTNVAAAGAAMLSTEDQTLAGGARVTSKSLGTITTGTLTLDPGDRPLQHYTNNGAHTLAPGSNTGSILLDITNDASAGAITTSGWTKVSGDSFTTTNGHKFRCHCSIGNGGSLLVVQALQ